MSTIPPKYQSPALLGLAAVLAVQIPSSIAAINDPLIRTLIQVSVLVLVILFAWKAQPPKDPPIPPSQAIVLREKEDTPEPITEPDPPTTDRYRFNATC